VPLVNLKWRCTELRFVLDRQRGIRLAHATEPLGRSASRRRFATVATWLTTPHTILKADHRPRHRRG
jgi:hypothetical protein